MARDRFRDDLFYLLNVFPIEIPPLRERGEDVVVITEAFLGHLIRKHGKKIAGITPEARAKMHDYSWPGNLRELINVLERAVILAAPGAALSLDDLALQGVPRNNLTLFATGVLSNHRSDGKAPDRSDVGNKPTTTNRKPLRN